ncbi:unnamed protein product, partial [Prorocentrum cordatum]
MSGRANGSSCCGPSVHRDRRHECWVIETPDGDRDVERKADWPWDVSLLHGWLEGFAGNAARFRAEVGREVLRQMVLEGCDLAREERRRRRLPRQGRSPRQGPDDGTVDWRGDERGLDAGVLEAARRRPRGKRPLLGGGRAPQAPGDEEATRAALGDAAPLGDAESALLAAELHAGGGLALGDELAASGAGVSAGAIAIGRRADGRPAPRERAPLSDAAAWRAQAFEDARSLAPPPPPPHVAAPAEERRPRDLRDALRAPVEEVGGASTPREARAEQQPEDVRRPAARGAGCFLTGTGDPFDAASPEMRNFANREARGEAERLAALGQGRTLAAGPEAGATRGGQIYPLPPLRELDAGVAGLLGRRDRARVQQLARAQRRAQFLEASWGAPADAEDSQQCLARLLRGRGGNAQLAHATLIPFSHARPSVPEDSAGSPRIADLLPEVDDERPWPAGRGEELDDALGGLDAWLGVSDVKDCFHRLLLDAGPGLQEFFGCPPLRAAELGLAQLGGVALERGTLLYPLARAPPMGWAWSLRFAQAANAHRATLLRELDRALPTSDRGPPLLLDSPLALGHCACEDQVRSALEAATESLGQAGLEVHETAPANDGGEALGVKLNGRRGCTRPAPPRFWRLSGAVQALLRRRKVSGVELEIVVGHLAFPGLVRRESLSGPRCTCSFIQRRYYDGAELWRSVGEELWAFTGPMIFLRARPRHRPGAGAARRRAVEAAGLELLADGGAAAPKARAGGVPEEEVDRRCRGPAFEEVPAELLRAGRWGAVLADRWAFEEGVLHLEGRALVKAARSAWPAPAQAATAEPSCWVTTRRRSLPSHQRRLLTMIRRAAAGSFGRGLRFIYKWIPSEFDSSDEGGRKFAKEYESDKCVTHLLPGGGWDRDRSGRAPDGPDVERAPATSAIHLPEPSWLEKGGASVEAAAARLAASEASLAKRRAPAGPGQPSAGADPSAGIGAARGQVGRVDALEPQPPPSADAQQGRLQQPGPAGQRRAHAVADGAGARPGDALGLGRGGPPGQLQSRGRSRRSAAEDASENSCEEELPGRSSARADARRAAARARRMAWAKLPPGQTILDAHSVKAATRARYQMHVDVLIAFADKRNAPLVEGAEVDDCIGKWMNTEFSEGRCAWRGEGMFTFPGISRNGSRKLPRAFQRLRGWRILSPPMIRTPLPWPTRATPALQLVRRGRDRRSCLVVFVMVEARLRPSELLSPTRRSLLPPARGGLSQWCLLLFPSAKGVTRSKTGEADDTVVMDSSRTPSLNYMFHRLSRGPGDERAAVALGFEMVPCQGRRSGASIDRAQRVRSAARYERAGRLNDAWRELTASQQECALDCERQLE